LRGRRGSRALGAGASRAVGALRERIPGGRTNQAQGVTVEVGERQAAIDIQLVADYGVSIADLSAGIRRNEDTMTIQIQDPTGAHHSLVKSRLRSLKRLRGATPMPPFGEMLSKQQLDDLVTYLALQRRRR